MESVSARRPTAMQGLQPGAWLDHYRIVRRIGSGGMGELYLAKLEGRGGFVKPVALKLMHPHLRDDPSFVEMFLREARIVAKLSHPNIVQVLDVGGQDADYLALEYVHGLDFRQLLCDARRDPLPLACILRIVLDVCAALECAHELCDVDGRPLALVHRDVSPGNILVAYDGTVKLTDFGVARVAERAQATMTTSLKGKIGYMSPEQCVQEPIDRRSDVFALGVVLYEATTLRRPFVGEPIAVLNAVVEGHYPRPRAVSEGYPAELAAIVERALANHASARYGSAAELSDALEAFASRAGLDVRPAVLEAELARRYGRQGPPDLFVPSALSTAPDDAPTEVRHLASRGPRTRLLIPLGLVLGVGGLAGWSLGRSTTRDPVEATDGPADAPSPNAAQPDPAARQADVPETAPSTTRPETIATPPPSPPAAQTHPQPTQAPPKRRRKKSVRRPRNEPGSAAKPDPRDAMLPRPSP